MAKEMEGQTLEATDAQPSRWREILEQEGHPRAVGYDLGPPGRSARFGPV